VRQNNPNSLLLHEFLHVLVEQEAGDKAPLWLREGLVETLASPVNDKPELVSVSEIDAELAHPANAAASRHGHRVAAEVTALLCARYGVPAVRAFLRNGVPPDVIKTLGS
jgi:stage II sporulation protein D